DEVRRVQRTLDVLAFYVIDDDADDRRYRDQHARDLEAIDDQRERARVFGMVCRSVHARLCSADATTRSLSGLGDRSEASGKSSSFFRSFEANRDLVDALRLSTLRKARLSILVTGYASPAA